jgi:hypothetical protein
VIGRLPGEQSCLSLVWAVLDWAAKGWWGLAMTPRRCAGSKICGANCTASYDHQHPRSDRPDCHRRRVTSQRSLRREPCTRLPETPPRPLLVLNLVDDQVVAVTKGERIFAMARQPQGLCPLLDADHLLTSRRASARPSPLLVD